MAVATKEKRPARRIRKAVAVESVNLDPKLIDPSPYQPRLAFPKEEIRRLADSIGEQGQLQPISVRRKPGNKNRYELVDGERRLRAAKELKLPTIRAEIQPHTDAQARAAVLVSALQREDLNAIEEATAYQQAIAAGDYAGPTELARAIGISQGQVSNRLRLLELPESVKRLVISCEMPATHAREIVRYAGHPQIMAAIEKEIADELKHQRGLPSVESFRTDMVEFRAEDVTRPLKGCCYDKATGRRVDIFTPTEEEAGPLDIVELADGQKRAANTKLWDRLQAQHAKQLAAADSKKGGNGKARQPKAGKPQTKKLTEAQQKELDAVETQMAAKRAKQFRRHLFEVVTDWKRWLIAQALLDDDQVGPEDLLQIVTALAAEWTRNFDHRCLSPTGVLECAVRSQKGRVPAYGPGKLLRPLSEMNELATFKTAAEFAAGCFWRFDRPAPNPMVPDEDVHWICGDFFAIDVGKAWTRKVILHPDPASRKEYDQPIQLGPLSEAYWNLHTRDQLVELGRELKVPIDAKMKKGEAVQKLLGWKKLLPLPKEIGKIKRPK